MFKKVFIEIDIVNYNILIVVEFYIANSYSRKCLCDSPLYNHINSAKEIKKMKKKLINLDKPSRELLQSIIYKIIIDKDRSIEIFYKFSLLNNI